MDTTFGLDLNASTTYAFEHVRIAVHEAGHATMALHYGASVTAFWVECSPRPDGRLNVDGRTGAEFDAETVTADQLVLFAVAGKAAERLWLTELLDRYPDNRLLKNQDQKYYAEPLSGGDQKVFDTYISSSAFRDSPEARFDAQRLLTPLMPALLRRATAVEWQCDCIHLPDRFRVPELRAPQTPDPEPIPRPAAETSPTLAPEPKPAPQQKGNTAMSSVDEIRHALSMTTDKATRIAGALQQARTELEETQQLLHQALSSSNQPEAAQAISAFTKAQDDVAQVQQAVLLGRNTVETVSAAL